jgi:ribose-phosphate pyrophosphokinase
MERAVIPGEVVTCKTNVRLLSKIPSFGFGNGFLLLDLHVSGMFLVRFFILCFVGILHYFEGSLLRSEISAMNDFIKILEKGGVTSDRFMFASADLGRPK